MPRKSKVVQAAQREETLQKLNNPPPHIKARMGPPSRMLGSLHTVLWNGLVNMADGQLGRHPHHDASANRRKEAKALREALAMEERFPDELWTRNGASTVAAKLGIHPSTVRRAKQRLKRACQMSSPES